MSKNYQKVSSSQKKNNSLLYSLLAIGAVALIVLAAILLGQPAPAAPAATATPPVAEAYPAEISVAQAAEKRDAGAFILDVREPEEWAAGHIPGATLIPLGELQNRVNELPSDREIVVVCRSGNRSQQGRDILRNAGLEQVTSMAGEMNQWQSAGYEVVTGP